MRPLFGPLFGLGSGWVGLWGGAKWWAADLGGGWVQWWWVTWLLVGGVVGVCWGASAGGVVEARGGGARSRGGGARSLGGGTVGACRPVEGVVGSNWNSLAAAELPAGAGNGASNGAASCALAALAASSSEYSEEDGTLISIQSFSSSVAVET